MTPGCVNNSGTYTWTRTQGVEMRKSNVYPLGYALIFLMLKFPSDKDMNLNRYCTYLFDKLHIFGAFSTITS